MGKDCLERVNRLCSSLGKLIYGFIQLWVQGGFLVLTKWWSLARELVWIVFGWNDCSNTGAVSIIFFELLSSLLFWGEHKLTFTNCQLLRWVIWPLEHRASHVKQVGFFILIYQMHLATLESTILFCILLFILVFCLVLWVIGLCYPYWTVRLVWKRCQCFLFGGVFFLVAILQFCEFYKQKYQGV